MVSFTEITLTEFLAALYLLCGRRPPALRRRKALPVQGGTCAKAANPDLVSLSLEWSVDHSRCYKSFVDCSKESLGSALANVKDKDLTIQFTGVCAGPVAIRRERPDAEGCGHRESSTAPGRTRSPSPETDNVTLSDFEVRNGLNGIVGLSGAHLTLSNVSAHDNFVFGIHSLSTGVERFPVGRIRDKQRRPRSRSRVRIRGDGDGPALTASANRVFGINVNGSSITVSRRQQ